MQDKGLLLQYKYNTRIQLKYMFCWGLCIIQSIFIVYNFVHSRTSQQFNRSQIS